MTLSGSRDGTSTSAGAVTPTAATSPLRSTTIEMREVRATSTRVTRPESTRRLTVVAPHPDDEVFGIGGLMRELVLRGHRLRVLAVTDGEAAYGPRNVAARDALAELRAEERTTALEALGIAGHTEVIRLQFPDAAVADHEAELTCAITQLSGPLLLATWRHDGHQDHEATGRAAARAAVRRSIPLIEYTVWAEHRGRCLDERLVWRVSLPADSRRAKGRAIDEFASQLEPSPDGRPVVPPDLVERLRVDDEVLLSGRCPA